MAKAHNRAHTIRIIGKTREVPHGLRAEGLTYSGKGHVYYVASPKKKRMALVQTAGSTVRLKLNTKTNDAPKALSGRGTTEAKAEDALKSAGQSIPVLKGTALSKVKGSWTGKLHSESSGLSVVLSRSMPGWGRLAVVGSKGEWQGAARMAKGGDEAYREGPKRSTLKEAIADAFDIMGELAGKKCATICASRVTAKRIPGEGTKSKKRAVRAQRKRATTANRARKAISKTDVTVEVPKSLKALIGKYIVITHGADKAKIAKVESVCPGASPATSKWDLKIKSLVKDGSKVRLAKRDATLKVYTTRNGRKVRTFKDGTKTARLARAQKVVLANEVKVPRKKRKGKKKTTGTRGTRNTATPNQKKLIGTYITFKAGPATRHGHVTAVNKNAAGNFNKSAGGAKLSIKVAETGESLTRNQYNGEGKQQFRKSTKAVFDKSKPTAPKPRAAAAPKATKGSPRARKPLKTQNDLVGGYVSFKVPGRVTPMHGKVTGLKPNAKGNYSPIDGGAILVLEVAQNGGKKQDHKQFVQKDGKTKQNFTRSKKATYDANKRAGKPAGGSAGGSGSKKKKKNGAKTPIPSGPARKYSVLMQKYGAKVREELTAAGRPFGDSGKALGAAWRATKEGSVAQQATAVDMAIADAKNGEAGKDLGTHKASGPKAPKAPKAAPKPSKGSSSRKAQEDQIKAMFGGLDF